MSKDLVAISGLTSCGKTTILKMIKDDVKLISDIIHVDDYYKSEIEGEDLQDSFNWINWEKISCLDFEKLIDDLQEVIVDDNSENNKKLIFVEGFLLYFSRTIINMFDYCIFLNIDKKISKMRRINRDDWLKDNLNYYDEIIYPTYYLYNHLIILFIYFNKSNEDRTEREEDQHHCENHQISFSGLIKRYLLNSEYNNCIIGDDDIKFNIISIPNSFILIYQKFLYSIENDLNEFNDILNTISKIENRFSLEFLNCIDDRVSVFMKNNSNNNENGEVDVTGNDGISKFYVINAEKELDDVVKDFNYIIEYFIIS